MIETVHAGRPGPADGPLATFWVQCYAHEAYVAESVASALAQSYRPLDIVISDDGSPDRTFAVAAAQARGYAGPHRVSLFRSPGNRGMFPHVNEVMPHLRGAVIIWQSSDDIAHPDRARVLLQAMARPGTSGAFSNHRLIDDAGADRGSGLPAGRGFRLGLRDYAEGRFLDFTYGGTLCFERAVFDRLGPLPDARAARGLEHCLAFRAALLGTLRYVDEPLVRRRRHAASLTPGFNAEDRGDDPLAVHRRRMAKRIAILRMLAGELAAAGMPVPDFLRPGLQAQIEAEGANLQALDDYRARFAAASDRLAARWLHAGLVHDPAALVLAGRLANGMNLLAYECRYIAVPRGTGAVEPCGIRRHAYPGLVSAFSLAELLDQLAATEKAS